MKNRSHSSERSILSSVLAIFLIFTMVFGTVPAWATGDDIEITDTTKHDAKYSDTDYVGINANGTEHHANIPENAVNSIKTGDGGVSTSKLYGISCADKNLTVGSLKGGISLTNNGGDAYGITVRGGTTKVDKLRSIEVSGTGYADAIDIGNKSGTGASGSAIVTFTGAGSFIKATGTGTTSVTRGIVAEGAGTMTVSNLDKITAEATNISNSKLVCGIYKGFSNAGTLKVALTGNERSITATSAGTGKVYGVYLYSSTSYIGQYTDDDGNTVGEGIKTITATTAGSGAYGIYAEGTANTIVTFTGAGSSITATNNGTDPLANAFGIYAASTGTTEVNNLGGMTVNASGGAAYGIYAEGGTTKVTFSGSGANDKVHIAGKLNSYFLHANNAANVEITGDSSSRTKVTFDNTGTIRAIRIVSNSGAPTVKLTNMDINVPTGSSNCAIYADGGNSTPASVELTNTLLKGDVGVAESASLSLAMDAASTLTGNLDFADSGTLNFTNNGTWYPVFDDSTATSSNKVTTFVLGETGVINMNEGLDSAGARDFRTLTLTGTSFTSNGGTFAINTDLASGKGDLINLASVSTVTGTAKVKIAYDPCFETGANATGSYKFLQLPSTSTLGVTGAATSYKGALYTPTFVQDGADWKITSITVGATETTKAVSNSASMLNFAWVNTINNLQKRMGDLRGGEASDMAWARFQRNNDDVNVGDKQSLSGNLYQIGYDFLIKSNDVAKNYFGLSFDVFDGTQSYKIGGGDAKSMTLSAYYTKIYESGHYFDFIMRYGRFESDTTSYDSSLEIPELTKLDYAMNGITLSGEYGYRAKLGNGGLYLEPQAEFIYGYMAGTKATSSTGLLADIDSTNHFVGRLGLAFGQKVKCFNYYLRGSYYHDFAGTSHVKYGVANYKQDGAENWWEVTLGGGWNLSKVSYFYAELTKHFKDISNSLNFNLGFRLTL